VPFRSTRTAWASLLAHIENGEQPPLCCIVTQPCNYPALLTRIKPFHLSSGETDCFRAVERWALRLHARPKTASFVPARLPWFERPATTMDALWRALVDSSGTASARDSAVAQEFAREAAAHFRDIIWVACGNRSGASVLGEIAEILGSASYDRAAIEDLIGRHRILLVLDDVRSAAPLQAPETGRGSVLVVNAPHQAQAIDAAPDDAALHGAFSACRRGDDSLDLAAYIAGLEPADAAEAAARLVLQRILDPLDIAAGRFRVVAPAVDADRWRAKHASVLRDQYRRRRIDAERCTLWLGEVEGAVRWSMANDWATAVDLAMRAYDFLRSRQRLAEGIPLIEELKRQADLRGDAEAAANCENELSWVRGSAPLRRPAAAEQLALF
jgi:hypothetical protein